MKKLKRFHFHFKSLSKTPRGPVLWCWTWAAGLVPRRCGVPPLRERRPLCSEIKRTKSEISKGSLKDNLKS